MVGLTIAGVPLMFPGFQVYPVAPMALRVDEKPIQIGLGEADGITVGIGTTVTVIVLVPRQPNPFAPINV